MTWRLTSVSAKLPIPFRKVNISINSVVVKRVAEYASKYVCMNFYVLYFGGKGIQLPSSKEGGNRRNISSDHWPQTREICSITEFKSCEPPIQATVNCHPITLSNRRKCNIIPLHTIASSQTLTNMCIILNYSKLYHLYYDHHRHTVQVAIGACTIYVRQYF